MEESPLIAQANAYIQSVKGKRLSLQERCEASVVLAAMMLEESQRLQTQAEKRQLAELAGMMNDPIGKIFTTAITDQCFRSRRSGRVADQLVHLIKKYGIPAYLSADKRLALQAFTVVGQCLSPVIVPLTIWLIRKEANSVILPGEEKALAKHMEKRRQEGVRINLNRLGEAILGEEEASRRLKMYLADLAKPSVEYISIKISTIYSQIHLLAWDETLEVLADRLRQLYRAAMKNDYVQADGKSVPKFVNLDMEEYRDLHLTVALFRKVLSEPEFYQHKAGIVLQSYLPDSFLIQQELTGWAMQRLMQGGAPIKIRLVKGANLAMEQFEAALRLWPQAPYHTKADVDANYKRMVTYGCEKEHARAAHLGIASHNLFDIAYAMLLRAENGVEQEVCFEMLEGMADHIRRALQKLSGEMLLYCPAATKAEFQNAVAYLVRRLDENTAPENFLRHIFDLKPGSEEWQQQVSVFSRACHDYKQVSYKPRRFQNRLSEEVNLREGCCFQNVADTDWSLSSNRKWAVKIIEDWKRKEHQPIPLVINGHYDVPEGGKGIGEDPSYPGQTLYHYALATQELVDQALEAAQKAQESWSQTLIEERAHALAKIAQGLAKHRGQLIGAMIADTGKTIQEADSEVSEAIDFAHYYRLNLLEWAQLPDIKWKAKGIVLVAPPWNFPCSIAAGGMLAALATGNTVIFKPAAEAVLVAWHLVQIFWDAGISQQVLQFIPCEDEPVGSRLIQDPRVAAVVLTGATETAKLFLRLRPDLDLMAETGGKNTLVITAMSDRDLAIKDLIHSAFGHAGQKCSACSLAILEAEVYDDPHFRKQLRDAAASLIVGSPWNVETKVNPLIRAAHPALLRALTTLEEGEEWLLKPQQDLANPYLWSPGIKLGVKPKSFTFTTELFGPVLGLVRAETFTEALTIMNQTAYGLTAGIHSLDEREQQKWIEQIEAGNCYINRTITGAIVERQPFGGCKDSSFGKGSKAGGPNYLVQFMKAEQTALPSEQEEPTGAALAFSQSVISQQCLTGEQEKGLWKASVRSYAFYWSHYFSKRHDPSLVMGQDNLQSYKPHRAILLRGRAGDSLLDLLRVMAAASVCAAPLEVSLENKDHYSAISQLNCPHSMTVRVESEQALMQRIQKGEIQRVRLLGTVSVELQEALAHAACHLNTGAVLANGRIELLHLLREVSISCDYQRYGNLGDREKERRHPLPGCYEEPPLSCGACMYHG